MNKKVIFLVLLIIFLLIALFYIFLGPRGVCLNKIHLDIGNKNFPIIVGEYFVSVKSPTPYPRAETEERTLLWQEEINLKELLNFNNIDLNKSFFDSLEKFHWARDININNFNLSLEHIEVILNFEKFNVFGNYTDDIYYEIDYGECNLNAPEGFTRTLIDPNTIHQKQIVVEDSEYGIYSSGSLEIIPCGIVSTKRLVYFDHLSIPDKTNNFLTYSQLYENRDKYLEGDFIVIKNSVDEVIYVSNNSQNSLKAISFKYTDNIKIELYGNNDDIDNLGDFLGFHLNKIIFYQTYN
jgi:hypothetical protein